MKKVIEDQDGLIKQEISDINNQDALYKEEKRNIDNNSRKPEFLSATNKSTEQSL